MRATVSVGRIGGGHPGRQREQHLVAGAVTERVIDRLEPVEVKREDRDVDALSAPAGECLLEPVERQRPIWQVSERVVQRRMPRRLLIAVALDGNGDQCCDRREECDLVLGKRSRFARMDVQDPELPVVAIDRDREAADNTELEQLRSRREAALCRHVPDDHGLTCAQDVFGNRPLGE
jgi:hypothetical protein